MVGAVGSNHSHRGHGEHKTNEELRRRRTSWRAISPNEGRGRAFVCNLTCGAGGGGTETISRRRHTDVLRGRHWLAGLPQQGHFIYAIEQWEGEDRDLGVLVTYDSSCCDVEELRFVRQDDVVRSVCCVTRRALCVLSGLWRPLRVYGIFDTASHMIFIPVGILFDFRDIRIRNQ